MIKDKAKFVIDYMIKHSKVAFPVLVIAAVAVTVSVALNMGKEEKLEKEGLSTETAEATDVTETGTEDYLAMVLNENQDITNLINTYYTGVTEGNADLLNSVCDEISLQDMLGYQEKSKYIDRYSAFEIYTKPGFEGGSTIAFVYYRVLFVDHPEEFPGYSAHYICSDDQGNLYIKRSAFTDEQNAYLGELMSQEDVVEFNNRVTVEYNELMVEKPELLEYLSEMDSQVNAAVGVGLADQNSETDAEGQEPATPGTEGEAGAEAGVAEGTAPEGTEQTPAENTVQYATATTTVNVRSSDSEKADRLGKVSGGEKLQVLEQKPNGWTKVLYENKDGFIKSEFLQLAESAEGVESIGTVTATTNINVRATASETADRLGVLAGGESVELLAKENGWCKIKYSGQIGYVKADYVQE